MNGFASRIRPFRIVLGWQFFATLALALAFAIPWGGAGAVSAALGGAVNLVACGAYAWRVSRREAKTTGEALATLFGAWAVKLALIVAQLGLVLVVYRDIVHAAFFATFVVTVGVFAAAVAVRDPGDNKTFK